MTIESSLPSTATLHFGPYCLDIDAARLTRDGDPVALRPKAFEVLVALARSPDRLVTKDELLDRVWGRRFITEGVVKSVVGELRSALDDDPKQPRWIETVARRGYRFVGRVGPAADSSPPPGHPAASSAGSSIGNLPRSLAPPIGRDEAIASVSSLHDAHRLVTIAGPAGVGKTRLALALASSRRDAWRDGVWFIELASLVAEGTDVAAIGMRVVQTLHLDASAGASVDTLARALRPLEALLVFDNAEHVIEAVASLVCGLLSNAPSLRIVVTSQEPLRSRDERVYRLAPLGLPTPADDGDEERLMASTAVQLFVERISSRVHGFALAPQQQRAVAAICRALDGMPLALELAAARVPLLGVHGIADLLLGDDPEAPLRLLTGGERTAAPRQRTLRNAIEWSYRLLDERQQRVFLRLAVFSGGFTLDAVRRVCADDGNDDWFVLDTLHALVDKSLVEASDPEGRPRFRLLESLRAFALERLVDDDDHRVTRDRHLDATIAYWQEADDRALGEPALAWVERHLVEVDNLRAALRWAGLRAEAGVPDALLALAASAGHFWCRAGLGREGWRWTESARAALASCDEPALQRGVDLAVATLGLYANACRPDVALPAAERAAVAFEEANDRPRAYYALYLVFQLALRASVVNDRPALLARMETLESPGWSDVLKRFLRNARGYHLRLTGDAEGYLKYCRAERALCRSGGALAEGWVAAQGLMLADADLGRRDEALSVADEAIDEIRAHGRLRQHAAFVALRATLLAERGDVERTRAALVEALPVLHGAGNPWMAHVALAWHAAHDGRDEAAARVVGRQAAAVADGSAAASGVYVTLSLDALRRRLTERLGDAAFERCCIEGGSLDDARAERLALGDDAARPTAEPPQR